MHGACCPREHSSGGSPRSALRLKRRQRNNDIDCRGSYPVALHMPRFAAEQADVVRRGLRHRVYVVLLENPRGDGRNGYYVGMTGLPIEERFANHKRGYKSAGVVRKYGVGLAWDLFDGIPAMSYKEAALTESNLADDLRDLGYLVYGPTNRKLLKREKRHVSRRRAAGGSKAVQ